MRGIVVVCAVIGLAATGCSGTAEPQTLPTPSADQQATGVLTPRPQPPAAQPDEPSLPGDIPVGAALAFVDSYMQLAESSLRDPDALAQRRSLFAPSCDVCRAGADAAAEILESGFGVEGGEVSFEADVLRQDDSVALVSVSHTISEIRLTDESGATIQSAGDADQVDQVFQLGRQPDGTWLVLSIEQLPS